MKKQKIVHAVVVAMLSANISAFADTDSAPAMEKCYGVVKSGKNDCAIPNRNACSGRVNKDNDAQAWIFVPKGTCNKIAGGSTSPKE
jgi:uncharacterized membrane protein